MCLVAGRTFLLKVAVEVLADCSMHEQISHNFICLIHILTLDLKTLRWLEEQLCQHATLKTCL